jgi:Mg-chelatase subunit ChlD
VPLFFGGLLGRSEFETQLPATATILERDLCLVIDRSDSMSGQPWEDLRAAVSDFCQAVRETPQQETVGFVSFTSVPQLEERLTTDVSRIEAVMARLQPARSQTNIGGGIDMGRFVLNAGGVGRERIIVLMSDGWHNVGTNPLTAASRAAADGTVIHAITFGWFADQDLMRTLADMTGGTFNHAPDGATLRQIFRDIALKYRNVLTE